VSQSAGFDTHCTPSFFVKAKRNDVQNDSLKTHIDKFENISIKEIIHMSKECASLAL
jgi:hypothetical protein